MSISIKQSSLVSSDNLNAVNNVKFDNMPGQAIFSVKKNEVERKTTVAPKQSAPPEVDLNRSALQIKQDQNKPGASSKGKPEIIIFDEFNTSNGKIGKYNIDGTGVAQETHGGLLSKISYGRTGIKPKEVHDDITSPPNNAIKKLKELLGKSDLSNVYINISNDGNQSPEFANIFNEYVKLLQQVAEKGAKIFVAAGNNYENPLAKALSGQKNVYIVSASGGVIGENSSAPQITATIETSSRNLTTNGKIVTKVTRDGGIDITGDGNPEYPANSLPKIPRDVSGMKLSSLDATEKVEMLERLRSMGNRNQRLNLSPSDNSVATFKSLRSTFPEVILPGLIKALSISTGRSPEQLDSLYMSINNFSDYAVSRGNKGGIVFYKKENNDTLSLVKQTPMRFLFPMASFASINALSEAVNSATRQ